MRVLLTSTDNPYTTYQGGKHIHLLLLEQGLKTLGIQVTTLYYNKKSLKETIKRYSLTLYSENARNRAKLELMMHFLQSHAPKESFDIIHAHDVLSILALGSRPEKKVLTLHGYFARENIEFITSKTSRETVYPHFMRLEKEGVEVADYIITVDQKLKEYAVSELNYPENRITVMYNAVDTDKFSPPSKEEQTQLKESLGFSANDFVVLVPRRLVEKNGVIYAVQSMEHVKSSNVKMIIAGDGPEKQRIKEEAGEDQRICFAGLIPHDRIDSYYKMADVILIPSVTSHGIQEATSLAMLEGMACGKVVLCSNIGGMKEIVQNTKNAILVREKEPNEIAETIENIMENQRLKDEIGRNARDYVMQNHSFIAHASKVAQIYRDVLGE